MTKKRQKQSGDPTPLQVYQAANKYVEAGLSLIPIRADGTKMPAFELLPPVWSHDEGRFRRPWSPYRKRHPTCEELRQWYADPPEWSQYGMAILGGVVSGGLEIIDCDNWEVAQRWANIVKTKAAGMLERLVLVRSPRPGLHAYYRVETPGRNQKLARVPDPEKANKKPKTIIELKSEGGYCLAPPSPAACHKTGKCYTFMGTKDLTKVQTITLEERETLLSCARLLNCWVEPERQPRPIRPLHKKGSSLNRREYHRNLSRGNFLPGDDFNLRGKWDAILEPHGWRWVRRGCDDSDQWLRPGKNEGSSATTNYAGSDLLFVFSSNAPPFDEMKSYTKFHAYTLLQHDGDFGAAARALARLGYGTAPTSRQGRNCSPFARYASYPVRSKSSRPN